MCLRRRVRTWWKDKWERPPRPLRNQPRAPRERLWFRFPFVDINELHLRLSIFGVRHRTGDPAGARMPFKVSLLTTSLAKRKYQLSHGSPELRQYSDAHHL